MWVTTIVVKGSSILSLSLYLSLSLSLSLSLPPPSSIFSFFSLPTSLGVKLQCNLSVCSDAEVVVDYMKWNIRLSFIVTFWNLNDYTKGRVLGSVRSPYTHTEGIDACTTSLFSLSLSLSLSFSLSLFLSLSLSLSLYLSLLSPKYTFTNTDQQTNNND